MLLLQLLPFSFFLSSKSLGLKKGYIFFARSEALDPVSRKLTVLLSCTYTGPAVRPLQAQVLDLHLSQRVRVTAGSKWDIRRSLLFWSHPPAGSPLPQTPVPISPSTSPVLGCRPSVHVCFVSLTTFSFGCSLPHSSFSLLSFSLH